MIHKIEEKWGYLNTCPTVLEDQRYPGTVGEKENKLLSNEHEIAPGKEQSKSKSGRCATLAVFALVIHPRGYYGNMKTS